MRDLERVALHALLALAAGLGSVRAQAPARHQSDSLIVPDSNLVGVKNGRWNAVGLSAWARARGMPTFSSYAVPSLDTIVITPVAVRLRTPDERRFRTVLTQGAKRGPN